MSLTADTRRIRVQRYLPIRIPTLETARQWRCECGVWINERDFYCGYCGRRTAPSWLASAIPAVIRQRGEYF